MVDRLNADTGLKTAVEMVHDPAEPVPNAMNGEQLPLLPLEKPKARGDQSGGNGNSSRGVGRPAGSINKATKEWAEYLLSQYTSPLECMAATMTRGVQDMADQLGYNTYGDNGEQIRRATPDELKECLKLQLSCAKELAPYLHKKQPQAVDLGEGGLMNLNIFTAPVQDVQNAEGFDMEILDLNIEENQGVTDADSQKLNGEELNESAKSAENSDLQQGKPAD